MITENRRVLIADAVEVTFQHGEPRTFGLVIGADGLHSAVRELAFGDEIKFVRPLHHAVSIGTVPNHLDLDRWELIYSRPGRTVNLYSTGKAVDAKALLLFHAPDLTYDRKDIAAQKRLLRSTFADNGWETDRLLDGLDQAGDFYFDTVSQDHTKAFARYEQEMRPFVARNRQLGRANLARMVARSDFQSRLGAVMMKVLPWLPGKNAIIAKVTQPIHDAARAIKLEEYR